MTTPARTVADLLRDKHDPSHVAEIAGDALRRDLTSRQDMVEALEPLARRNGQPSGAALLEHLLDLVGLSAAALAENLTNSDLGKALVTAGQLSALKGLTETVSNLDIPRNALGSLDFEAMAAFAKDAIPLLVPEGALSKLDVLAIINAANFSIPVDTEAFRRALNTSFPEWLPNIIRSVPAGSCSPPVLKTASAERGSHQHDR
ncbi:hypothetical protein FYJ24_04930 [Actinomycetaceae bacterium WB03_NA08]|uniref:Uncharacterized protein n=1 Tax=Scrofimicrobium canadense TaxID=2652290 RepID=A0A6N7VT47_9ACTO|nr:hypothetical protein [Scrofimicrobium canadense]MSS84120.1 hypothetical protein [Scrofimicrobium canadense]